MDLEQSYQRVCSFSTFEFRIVVVDVRMENFFLIEYTLR